MMCPNCASTIPNGVTSCSICGVSIGNPRYSKPEPSGKAMAALVLGILSLFFWVFTAIPAVILGHMSRSEIRRSGGRLGGAGEALAGLCFAYFTLVVMPLLFILFIVGIAAYRGPRMAAHRPQAAGAVDSNQTMSLSSIEKPREAAMPMIADPEVLAANETFAAATVHTLNKLETTYWRKFSQTGYADLANLGPGDTGCRKATREAACLLDTELGCSAGSNGQWCIKGAYKYSIVTTASSLGIPDNYIITAVPNSSVEGSKSYCSTADAVVRVFKGLPEYAPLHLTTGCDLWDRLQDAN